MSNFWRQLKKPILALAPMAGITDSPFRQICKSFGADVVYTEMVSADGLAYKSKKTLELLKFDNSERPVILQLFGKNPENFAKAINIINQCASGKLLVTSDMSDNANVTNKTNGNIKIPDGIDINFGCPAKKVVAHGGGVTLMRNLKLCREIVKSVCETTALPVSVKIRTSILSSHNTKHITCNKTTHYTHITTQNARVTALDFLKYISDLPISAVMVHGRSFEQGFSGPIDAEMIMEIVKAYSRKWIILANGGINTVEDAVKVLKETNAHGLGLARGVYGRPWLFKEIKAFLKTPKGAKTVPEGGQALDRLQEMRQPPWAQIKKTMLKHATFACKSNGDHGIVEMRKHLAWYVRGLSNASELRRKLVRVKTIEEIKEILR